MKIALAQLNYTVGAVQSNKIKIIQSILRAKKEGADLVVFSEYAISGMYCYDLLNKHSFLESCEVALVEIATYCEGICVLVGLPVQQSDFSVISAGAFIDNGRIARYIGKKFIIYRDEKNFITPSKGLETVTVAGEKIDVILGTDSMAITNFSPRSRMFVCLCSDPYSRGVLDRRADFIRKLTYLTGKGFIGVNHLGGQSEAVFDGSSAAVNHDGNAIAILKSFEEDFCIIDSENAPTLPTPVQNITDNTYKAIKLGLRDYFEKNGFTKACLGLSGGIDSALVAAFAAEVLGPNNVWGLIMPSKFSSEHSVKDAVEQAELLGIKYTIIPIHEMYEQSLKTLDPLIAGTSFDNTEENLQARIRGMLLMALSNKHGYILLNTSNKSESAVGYSTLYGDMAGMYSIIGDIYKTEVYELANFLNRRSRVIPENIIHKEPSAELHDGQKDSDSLPPYPILDGVLYRFIDKGQSVDDIIAAGFEDEAVHRIINMLKTSTFKRRQSCPTLRLSLSPFNVGLVLPLVNKYIL